MSISILFLFPQSSICLLWTICPRNRNGSLLFDIQYSPLYGLYFCRLNFVALNNNKKTHGYLNITCIIMDIYWSAYKSLNIFYTETFEKMYVIEGFNTAR